MVKVADGIEEFLRGELELVKNDGVFGLVFFDPAGIKELFVLLGVRERDKNRFFIEGDNFLTGIGTTAANNE